MTRRTRSALFGISAIAFFAVCLWALHDMPPVGHYRGPYGDVLNSIGTHERHITDIVTGVNFDFRGIDTLGEEAILFLSVAGATLLLRRQKDEEEDEKRQQAWADESARREAPEASDATRITTLGLIGPLVVFGVYIVTHGQITPGGGFQGGVVLATAPLLVYIAGDLKAFKRITQQTLVEAAEAAGIFLFAGIGLLGVIMGGVFLQNVLPLGTTGNINSGGTIAALNIATGLAVAGGFVQLMYAFLEQTIELRNKAEKQ
jgi:multicomponent Na+:H+ antiporter subunit B